MYANYREEIAAELAEESMGQSYIPQKLPAVPTRQEIRLLLAAPKKPRDSLLLRLLYATGMRAGEIGTFKWCDLSAAQSTIFVRASKKDKDRLVCADVDTMRRLQAYRMGHPLSADVFGITTMTVWNVVRKYATETGLFEKYDALNLRFSPHTLRHSYATHCYENGMSAQNLQMLLGHVFLETTRIYVHVGMEHAAAEYRRTHELARSGARG